MNWFAANYEGRTLTDADLCPHDNTTPGGDSDCLDCGQAVSRLGGDEVTA